MIATLLLLAAAVLPQVAKPAAPSRLPPAPPSDLTLPPEGAELVTILEARGVQTYTCTAGVGGYFWVSSGPDAQLFNLATGRPAGQHSAGPTWTVEDGSAVTGEVVASKTAANAMDVPWLLLHTAPAQNSKPNGMLAPVSFVRRYNTHGGAAPGKSCSAAQQAQAVRIPYSASYAFYAAPGTPSLTQTTGAPFPLMPATPPPPPMVTPPPPPPPPPPPAKSSQ